MNKITVNEEARKISADLHHSLLTRYSVDDFDSSGELWLHWYLLELVEAGFVESFTFEPASFELTERQYYLEMPKTSRGSSTERVIMNASSYTPDFLIFWHPSAQGVFFEDRISRGSLAPHGSYHRLKAAAFLSEPSRLMTYSEIKPMHDQNKRIKRFREHIQKQMYDKHDLLVNLTQITTKDMPSANLFQKTFTPKRFLYCDKDQTRLRKIHYKPRMLDQYLEERGEIFTL